MSFYAIFWPILAVIAAVSVGAALWRGSAQLNFRDALGAFLVVAFIAVICLLLWRDIPKSNEQLIVYMLGQLSGFVAGVVAYHYVTKAGEKELEATRADNTGKAFEAIAAAAAAAPPTEPPPGSEPPLNGVDDQRPTGAPGDPVHTVEEPGP